MRPTIFSLMTAAFLAATSHAGFADSVLKEGEKLLQGQPSTTMPGTATTTKTPTVPGTPSMAAPVVPGTPTLVPGAGATMGGTALTPGTPGTTTTTTTVTTTTAPVVATGTTGAVPVEPTIPGTTTPIPAIPGVKTAIPGVTK